MGKNRPSKAEVLEPTGAWAGSDEKIELLATRAVAELPLHVEGDCLHQVDPGLSYDGAKQRRKRRRPQSRLKEGGTATWRDTRR